MTQPAEWEVSYADGRPLDYVCPDCRPPNQQGIEGQLDDRGRLHPIRTEEPMRSDEPSPTDRQRR